MSSNTTQLPDPIPDTSTEPIQNTGVAKLYSGPSETGPAAAPSTAASSTNGPPVQTTTNTIPHATTDAPSLVHKETVGTPGFPGAYPRGDSYLGASDEVPGSGILESAQTQLGSLAQSAAQYLPQNVKEAVAPYLPAGTSVTASASHHDTTHATSLPTTELFGAGTSEHVGGVGALPGLVTETGVADAKAVDDLHSQALVDQSLGERVKEAAAPYLPAAFVGTAASAAGVSAVASEHDKQHSTSLPSTEFTGAGSGDRVEGAGALPGRVGETGVADAESVAQMRETAPRAQQKTLGERVKESVAPYLPAAVVGTAAGVSVVASEHDRQHAVSLPSTELTGARAGEHVDGVGALPGSLNQSSVALLPDERNQPTGSAAMTANLLSARDAAAITTAQATTAASYETAAGTAGLAGLAARQPLEKKSMPTTEKEGAVSGEHVSGAGALPGKVDESGVAVLPDERGATSTEPKPTASDTTAQKDSTGPNNAGVPNRGGGYDTDYHPAKLHPPNEDYSHVETGGGAQPSGSVGEKSAEGTGQESHPGGTQGRSTNVDESKIMPEAKVAASNVDSTEDSSAGPTVDTSAKAPSPSSGDDLRSPPSPGKSKFMDKVKGEFKILAGKMTKNEGKVEEGRALKSGGSPVQDRAHD